MKRLGLRLATWGLAGLPALGMACSHLGKPDGRQPTSLTYPTSPGPASDSNFNVRLSPEPSVYSASQRQALPVSLDSVLRLADENNPQITLARAKVATAFAEKALAEARWVPDVNIGVGYWRHEGGIQLQEGPLIQSSTGAFLTGTQVNATFDPRENAFRKLNAARKIWQNHGELSKATSENLLEASTTYIDMLAAHAALAVSRDCEKQLKELHAKVLKAKKALGEGADIKVELAQVEAELTTQQLTQQKLAAAIDSAGAKLAYLLGLDCNVQLLPVDPQMAAFHIVDVSPPVEHLIATALSHGPGIQELEGILSVIQSGMDQAQKAGRFLPSFNVQASEGLFAAGPGGTLNYANRFDFGIQAKWNLSDAILGQQKRQLAHAQITQAQWTYHELRQKLTLGVQDARSTILTVGRQFSTAEEQIKRAKEVVDLNQKRIDNTVAGATYSQVLMSHRAVAMAQLNYIEMLREFDKAQLRLMIVLGPGARPPAAPQLGQPVAP